MIYSSLIHAYNSEFVIRISMIVDLGGKFVARRQVDISPVDSSIHPSISMVSATQVVCRYKLRVPQMVEKHMRL
jgi:hypothetical protein